MVTPSILRERDGRRIDYIQTFASTYPEETNMLQIGNADVLPALGIRKDIGLAPSMQSIPGQVVCWPGFTANAG